MRVCQNEGYSKVDEVCPLFLQILYSVKVSVSDSWISTPAKQQITVPITQAPPLSTNHHAPQYHPPPCTTQSPCTKHAPLITNHALPIIHYATPITNYVYHPLPCTIHAMHNPIANHVPPITNHVPPITSHVPPITSHVPPITNHASHHVTNHAPTISNQKPLTTNYMQHPSFLLNSIFGLTYSASATRWSLI